MGRLTATIVKACTATTILDLMFVLRSLSDFISRLVSVSHTISCSFRESDLAISDQVPVVEFSPLPYQLMLRSVSQQLWYLLICLPTCLLLQLVPYQIKVDFSLLIQMLHLSCRVEALSLKGQVEEESLFGLQLGCRTT